MNSRFLKDQMNWIVDLKLHQNCFQLKEESFIETTSSQISSKSCWHENVVLLKLTSIPIQNLPQPHASLSQLRLSPGGKERSRKENQFIFKNLMKRRSTSSAVGAPEKQTTSHYSNAPPDLSLKIFQFRHIFSPLKPALIMINCDPSKFSQNEREARAHTETPTPRRWRTLIYFCDEALLCLISSRPGHKFSFNWSPFPCPVVRWVGIGLSCFSFLRFRFSENI